MEKYDENDDESKGRVRKLERNEIRKKVRKINVLKEVKLEENKKFVRKQGNETL